MALETGQREKLFDALLSGFPGRNELDELVSFTEGLGSLQGISPDSDDVRTAIRKVIIRAESLGRLSALIKSAIKRAGENAAISKLDLTIFQDVESEKASLKPAISVCTVTKRTNPGFKRMLELLALQTFTSFEYLIIDGYYETRRSYVSDLLHKLSPPFPVKHLPPKPTRWQYLRPAISNARNTALLWSEGELIVNVDDCCVEMPTDFLARHLGWHTKQYAVSGSWDIDGIEDERRWQYPQAQQIDFGLFYGGNQSFPLQKALEINGFDEVLDGEQGQDDIVFAYMLRQANVRLMFDPDLSVTLDGSSHTLTQLSPDPRKAQWGTEWFARQPKTMLMSDGLPHYANEWLASDMITNKKLRPQGNHFELSSLRELRRTVFDDLGELQMKLDAFVDPDPQDWRDGERIADMSGGDFLRGPLVTKEVSARPIRLAAISADQDNIAYLTKATIDRFDLEWERAEQIPLRQAASTLAISPVTHQVLLSERTTWVQRDFSAPARLELNGPKDKVQALAVSETEEYVAAGAWDSSVHVWDFGTGDYLRSIGPLEGSVTGVAFTKGTSTLIAGTAYGYIYRWDLETWTEVDKIRISNRPIVLMLAFEAPKGGSVLVGLADGRLLSLNHSGEVGEFPQVHRASISTGCVDSAGSYAATCAGSGEIAIWHLPTRSFVQSITHSGRVRALSVSDRERVLRIISSNGQITNWPTNPRSGPDSLISIDVAVRKEPN
jgi:WD40 repeat protein